MKYKKGLANEARLSWARKRRKNSLPQMAEIDGQDERTDRGELGLDEIKMSRVLRLVPK